MGIVGRGGGGIPAAEYLRGPVGEQRLGLGEWLGIGEAGSSEQGGGVAQTPGSEVGKRFAQGKARARLNSRVKIGSTGRECSSTWLSDVCPLVQAAGWAHRRQEVFCELEESATETVIIPARSHHRNIQSSFLERNEPRIDEARVAHWKNSVACPTVHEVLRTETCCHCSCFCANANCV